MLDGLISCSGGPLLLEVSKLLVELRDLALELLHFVEASEPELGVDAIDTSIDVFLDAGFDLTAKFFGTLHTGYLAKLVLDLLHGLFDALLALLAKFLAAALELVAPLLELGADAFDAFGRPFGAEIFPIELVLLDLDRKSVV